MHNTMKKNVLNNVYGRVRTADTDIVRIGAYTLPTKKPVNFAWSARRTAKNILRHRVHFIEFPISPIGLSNRM